MPLHEIDGIHPPMRRRPRPEPWTSGQVSASVALIILVVALAWALVALRFGGML